MTVTGASRTPAARVAVEERLFSLVLALLATEMGLTKHEILSTVQGYRQRFVQGGDNSALERQFERDKDDIRDLGVPLETIDEPGDSSNNHALRYRIPRGSYELPAGIHFSPEEASLLNLAALVWREGSLSAESRRALLKLKGLGAVSDDPVLGYAPQLRSRDIAFEPLRDALDNNRVVRFSYLKPGDDAAREREVVPLAIVQHQGRWHLYGEECDSHRTKTFLLRRIVSPVVTTGETVSARTEDYAERALTELEVVWQSHSAHVSVVEGTDAAIRLGKRRGSSLLPAGTLVLHFSDLNIFADELASFGPEVVVLSPPEVRRAVLARLISTATEHGASEAIFTRNDDPAAGGHSG